MPKGLGENIDEALCGLVLFVGCIVKGGVVQ